jgi:signal transduction histidine kinase/CheY-like chemotaxis protein
LAANRSFLPPITGNLLKNNTLEYKACPLQAQGSGNQKAPSLADPVCACYRTRRQLQDGLSKFGELAGGKLKVAVLGQRRDMERVARFTGDGGRFHDQVCDWIPLNTYSALPGEALQSRLEGFFTSGAECGGQRVLVLEATGHLRRWSREIPEGVLLFEWVKWARERAIPLCVLLHRPAISQFHAVSMLMPFPWLIIKGKFWDNACHVPLCPVCGDRAVGCQRLLLKNINRLTRNSPVNQETLHRVSQMLHYYFGCHRVRSVALSLDPGRGHQSCDRAGDAATDCFPLVLSQHPRAAVSVVWRNGEEKHPDDFRMIHDAVEIVAKRYEAWQENVRLRGLQRVMDRVVVSCQCHVLGIRDNGSLVLVSGDSQLATTGRSVIRALPEAWLDHVRDAFRGGNPVAGHELSLKESDELDPVILWAEGHPVDDPDDDVIGLIVLRDITEKKKLETNVFQMQKQDTIRLMSGGITHDLNNVLSAVMGYASYLSMRLSPDNPLREDLDMIEKSTGRAADLVRRLLGYSRKSKKPTGLVSPNAICEEVARLLEPALNGSYRLDVQLESDVWPILGDANQIQQAIMNLCLNAKDAQDRGGVITVRTQNKVIGEGEPGFRSLKPGIYTVISVSDKGSGIPRELRRRVFDPFFTTKPAGKGTGLGLTMVRMITDNHGGKLVLRSRKERGTVVSLVFRAVARYEECADYSEWSLRGGREGVLVVDDEPSIVDMGAKILSDNGYRVFTATSVAEAEQMLSKHTSDIDLALLDIVFPENDGLGCTQVLKGLSPALKVVLLSGYPREACPVSSTDMAGYPFVQKPFHAKDLLQTVRKTLDEGRPESVVENNPLIA